MPNLPAICDACNILFPSPVVLEGNVSHFRFQDIGVRCPLCNARGYIPDGDYSVFDDAIELLAHEPFLLDRLRLLHAIVTEVINQEHDPQQAIKKIKKRAPELATILDKIPKTLILSAWVLGVLASVLSIAVSIDTFVNRPPSKAELQEMFDAAIERSFQSRPDVHEVPPSQLQPSPPRLEPYRGPLPDLRPPQPNALEPYRAPPKQGRNEPCACGSGKKYKFCCRI